MNVSFTSAVAILKALPVFIDSKGTISEGYGTVDFTVLEELKSTKKIVKGMVKGVEQVDYGLAHETNVKSISGFKEMKKVKEKASLPEGVVPFPDHYIHLQVRGKDAKKYAKKIAAGYLGIDGDHDSYLFLKGSEEEYFISMALDISKASPVMVWAVRPMSSSLKYAWVFEKLDTAIVKLRALEAVYAKAA